MLQTPGNTTKIWFSRRSSSAKVEGNHELNLLPQVGFSPGVQGGERRVFTWLHFPKCIPLKKEFWAEGIISEMSNEGEENKQRTIQLFVQPARPGSPLEPLGEARFQPGEVSV